jgi:glycosyltransferase involved in cell wall biosynthesis
MHPPPPKKIRILLLTDEMEVGGTQRQIVSIAKHLDRSCFEATVLFFRNPSFFVQQLESSGVRVIQVPKRGRLDLGFVWQLRQVLLRERFDVVQCFAFSGELWGAVARWLLPAAKRPVLVSSVRGVYVWYSALQWRIKRWVSGQSVRIIANSSMGAQYACERMGLPGTAVQITYNGVDAPVLVPDQVPLLRAQQQVPPAGVLVLFVGRLIEIKDVPTLLRAVARLHERVPGLRLAVAGEGPARGALQGLVVDLGLQGVVQFLGQRGDTAELMAGADIVVLPSLREGLSNVILEAMMAARPVVASRAGGNTELITHAHNGLLFEIGDDAALADALQLLANDSTLRLQLGQNAKSDAQNKFSTPAMVRSYEQHYSEVVRLAQ